MNETDTIRETGLFLDYAEDRDIGSRERQEDFGKFLTMDADADHCQNLVYTLADGMGGLAGGEIASRLVVNAFLRCIQRLPMDNTATVPQNLLSAMNEADMALGRRKQMEASELSTMGCTLCSAHVAGNRLHFLSVGDSLLYFVRQGKIWRLNELHNYREDMHRKAMREGLDWDEISQSPLVAKQGGRITSYIGGMGVRQVHCPSVPLLLQPGDAVIIASDGLLTLSANDIVRTLHHPYARVTAADDVSALLDLVLSRNRPHQDNVSIGLIRVVSH